ncbi:SDR family NAD(P)-dependent oxidoreductase [Natronomonas salina]|uniref:oxidoreductase n=1 Tax=Natronomonas salina TaxID=1710540 RepID=UPI0015B39139|nr:oxidoreductase [Natronomonas salina]QLD89922.1 SDR family NAD(P)-dependent oxidoreductase [Natronomonas salina]
MSKWTADDVPDCSGATVVVTGANSGLGLEATRLFAREGAEVVMACRDLDRAETAREEVRADVSRADLDVRKLDLADLDSVRRFADGVATDHERVDVLCNNAGVMALPRGETADGFERQFGVNHLGHFALTGLLLEALRAAPDPRVVTQSSGLHANGELGFEDLHGEADYDPWDAYAQSKLANLLFAYELDRRYGGELTSVGCHPGYAATNLQRRGPEQRGSRLRVALMSVANRLFAQPAERGALPMVYAATAEGVDGGEYVGPGGFRNMRGHPEVQRSSGRSYDEATARRLWAVSEELTGVEYPD